MKGWLISKDSRPHRERWARVLAPYFDDFEIVIDDWSANEWRPESDSDFVFTTNITETSIRYQSRISPDRHVAISNSLDLMTSGARPHSEQSFNELPSVREIWVDTHWAARLLENLVSCDVHYIPWGLEEFPEFEQHSSIHEAPIILPRLSSSHYNPDLLLEVIQLFGQLRPNSKFLLLGLPLRLHARAEEINHDLSNSLKLMPIQTEGQFLSLLQNSSAILMAPHTDGSSVTMLQAISGHVPVVSTPTVGAREWVSGGLTSLVSKDFSSEGLVEALQYAQSHVTNSLLSEARQKVLDLANLRCNTRALINGLLVE